VSFYFPLKVSMEQLLLDSLEVRGFRAFRHLEMPRLARVNLIVGRNNAGKTSVLEALRIYSTDGDPSTIVDILRSRDEMGDEPFGRSDDEFAIAMESAVEQMFNRQRTSSEAPAFRVGPSGGAAALEIGLEWVVLQRERLQGSLFEEPIPVLRSLPEPVLTVKADGNPPVQIPLDRLQSFTRRRRESKPSVWISAYGMNSLELGEFWDNIALTDLEEHVLNALRIIAPEVERLSLIGDKQGYRNRSVVVKLPGVKRPVPLRNMGDGMNRILGLALALVNASNGVMLADEIENGLHYSVQADMWRLIFRVADLLNVQVFATTHSWDCIKAFQDVANSESEIEGILHRLERRGDGAIKAVEISEENLAVIARQQIEIR